MALVVVKRRGYSLCGFQTFAAHDWVSIWKTQEIGRRKSVQVPPRCVRNAELSDDHAGGGFL